MKKTIKKLPKSEVQIDVSVPADVFETYRSKALKKMGDKVEIAGFRKGKAPLDILSNQFQPMAILEEMAEHVINEHLPKILVEEKIDAIGRPTLSITKIAEGNPLEFSVVVATVPEVKLPDYKAIAKAENEKKIEVTVTDEELEKAIIELKKARALREAHNHEHKEGEEHNHDHAEQDKKEDENVDASLTDECVKALGPFENVAEFREKFRENIASEKTAREREKRRIAIVEGILEKTEVEIPTVLAEQELENMVGRVKADIAQAGIPFEEYLKHIKKTEAEMRAEIMPDAEKRAKSELVIHTIGKNESLKPKPEDVEKEVKHLLSMYEGADPLRVGDYVNHVLMNETILQFLEDQR